MNCSSTNDINYFCPFIFEYETSLQDAPQFLSK